MCLTRPFLGCTVAILSLSLSGCVFDPTYNFDDGTLFQGKQAWETKRHADDWIQPIGDAVASLGLCALEQGAESYLNHALGSSTDSGSREESPEFPKFAPIPTSRGSAKQRS